VRVNKPAYEKGLALTRDPLRDAGIATGRHLSMCRTPLARRTACRS
jgi:hypothetical protein